MTKEDRPFTILFDLNPRWKLGRNGRSWHIWKRDPHTERFELEISIDGSRRLLIAELERRGVYPTEEAEAKLARLPETLKPWPREHHENDENEEATG